MTYRELSMIDVKELLRRWAAGQSIRRITRETGADRKTVRRYAEAATKLALPRERPPTDEEVQRIGLCVQMREEPAASAEWQELAKHRERIKGWLERKRPLRLTKVHKLLVREEGLEAGYDTLRRYARRELGWGKRRATVRLEDPPAGQEAQVDFGRMGPMLDPATGRMRQLWALVVTLSFSRYQFVWPTFAQTTAAVCEGLDHAWWFFGAMPRTIIPDNCPAMIKDPDALNPQLVAAFLDYVQARDLFVDPARIQSPRDKARVENQVPYVRESWFDGEVFSDLEEARRHAEHWCGEEAGLRIHGTTCQVPREVFEATEKATMLAPPTEGFDVPLWLEKLTVHPDHHVQVARALYSVPTLYLHKTVRARADRTTVKIYLGTELIKMHPRRPAGGRSTDPNDYPVGKAPYALRSVEALVTKARGMGPHIGTYAERLLGGPLPWTRMRQVYALLRLCDKFSPGRVEAVCQSALSFDVIDVARITRMLKTASKAAPPSTDRKVVQLTLPRFARPGEHFQTVAASTKKEGE